jgi:hypothetical protein
MKHVRVFLAMAFASLFLVACSSMQADLGGLATVASTGLQKPAGVPATLDLEVTPYLFTGGKGGNTTCSALSLDFDYISARVNYDGDGDDYFDVNLYTWTLGFNGKEVLDELVGTVRVTVSTDGEGVQAISYEVVTDEDGDISISHIIVKGSNASHIYVNDESTEVAPYIADSGLYAPTNRSTTPADLSNIAFCAGEEDLTSDEICEWQGETAWSDGSKYNRDRKNKANWATFTSYVDGLSGVDLLAGQRLEAGTVTFTDLGDNQVEITIVLNEGWRLAPEYDSDGNEISDVHPEAIKIQGYDGATGPTGNPNPGTFTTYKGDGGIPVADNTYVIVVGKFDYYGIHLDVEQGINCPTGSEE